jgi:tRNA 2-selenouridine synthase
MNKEIDIERFLDLSGSIPIIDVRSPGEFEHAHIPGAYNLPLFNNLEREIVGTTYKKIGREDAILKGLELVGVKLADFVRSAKKISLENKLLVHCWRGGMRSASMAWLLNTAGIETQTLIGGYKSYRRYIKTQFARKAKILVLGGMTGSGKTELLYHLQNSNQQVIDLEKLANHKGSAFGALGQAEQCSTEQFENLLYEEWKNLDFEKIVWFEDESQAIGKIRIPEEIYIQMRKSHLINVIISKEIRIERLFKEYGNFNLELLKNALSKIKKRLGGLNAAKAIEAIENNDIKQAIDISLIYYDKAYLYGLSNREIDKIHDVRLDGPEHEKNALKILQSIEGIYI